MRTEFDLSWARDIVEVFSKKISDCVLAGLDVSVLRIRFVNLLKDYKQTLEYHQLTDTEEYKDICFRLKLFLMQNKEMVKVEIKELLFTISQTMKVRGVFYD